MDSYLDTIKTRVELSLYREINQIRTILGEGFYKKWCLWEGEQDSYIEKMVVKNGNIFYQIADKTDILKLNDHGQSITPAEFYEPFPPTIQLSYPDSEFLTMGETVIKTRQPYRSFTVVEHFTKKIYFIAHEEEFMEGGSLYAADLSKGDKEVVAEKVQIDEDEDTDYYLDWDSDGDQLRDTVNNYRITYTALAVDQISGDIVLASISGSATIGGVGKKKIYIQCWQKLAHVSEWLKFVENSSSKENVKHEA